MDAYAITYRNVVLFTGCLLLSLFHPVFENLIPTTLVRSFEEKQAVRPIFISLP